MAQGTKNDPPNAAKKSDEIAHGAAKKSDEIAPDAKIVDETPPVAKALNQRNQAAVENLHVVENFGAEANPAADENLGKCPYWCKNLGKCPC